MRKSIDGLCAIVVDQLKEEPKAEYEYGREEERKEGIRERREEELACIPSLISKMTAGGDAEQISLLNNPEVLEEMKRKYKVI